MNFNQDREIRDLKEEVRGLREKVDKLESLRDQISGMGALAMWGIRALLVLGGWGAVDGIARLIHWLQTPLH